MIGALRVKLDYVLIVHTQEKEYKAVIAKLQEDSKRLLSEKDHIIKTMGEENKGVLQV